MSNAGETPSMSAAASDAGDAPASASTGAAAAPAVAVATASAPVRPSGRGRVKDTFIGITATNVRRGLPPPAHRTALVQQLELDPYAAYFGSRLPLVSGFAGSAKKMGRPRGSEQLTHAVTQQQQQLMQQAAAATAAAQQQQQQMQLAAPNGSMSARSTPIAGRRAAGASGSSTARVGTVITPRARVGLPPRRQQQQMQPKDEEEKNAAQQQQMQQFLPAWLQPLPHSSYPAPQAPLSPVPGLPWPATSSAAAEDATMDAPRPSLLPPTYSYSFYQPAHPRRAKTDRSVSPLRSESKQATHSRSSSPSRRQQQQAQKHPHAAPGEPESWSSWPFVNPRLVREQQPNAVTSPSAATASKEEKDASGTAVPALPGVPRLFGSVVSEHDRTLVFEYLRSTYSQLFQWPPQQPEPAATTAAADGSGTTPAAAAAAPADSAAPPPLPSVPFTDAQLERLIEEGHSAAGAIVLLRRLDAELALAVQSNTVGQPLCAAAASTAESAPSALDAALASRPPPRFLASAAELVEVVAATAAYLASINRALFQWFVRPRSNGETPMALFARTQAAAAAAAAASTTPTAATAPPVSSTSTVFVTQQMVDAMIAESARGGLAEEELWALLEQLNSTAVAATKHTGNEAERAVALQQHTFVNFDDLALAVRGHVDAKRRRMIDPNASTGDLSLAGQQQQPLVDASGAPLMHPPTDPALMLLPPAPPQRPPSPAALRHASQSLSYARLLLFKFLRDDSPAAAAAATDDLASGNGSGGGAALFSQARDVTASLAQMDSLIEATRGLTLGQNYHTMSYPRGSSGSGSNAASTVTSPTAVSSRHVSRDAAAASQASSRHPTRPPSPSSAENASGSAVAQPTGTVAAATRAYGSFLAARAIRVLRSLLFHGYSFRSFDDLILAAHIHTRKLHAERLKVFQFLTQSQSQNATGSPAATAGGKKLVSASTLPRPDAPPPPDLVSSLQSLTHSNASGGIGLFDAYYLEADRRERARILEEQARAEQLKLNTHQFGTSHLNQQNAVTSGPAPQQQTSPAAPTPGGARPAERRVPASRSAASKPVQPFHSSISESDRLAERRRHRNAGAIPSHIVPAVVPPKRSDPAADAAKFDWGLSPPVVVSSGGSDPAAIRAMQQAIAANGGVMPLNSPTITRYASAKTLPNIASKSQLLKHVDSTSGLQEHGSSGGEYDAVQLDPLVVTPEHVDALFGSFEHLLTLNVDPAVAAPVTPLSLPAGVPAAAASQLPGVALASAPTPVFDPLLEQADEDLLLESEKEDAYNSMDLTLLLQQYKAERPHELEERERVPSYLAAHPLFQPMLEEAQKHSVKHRTQQQPASQQPQQKVLLTSDSQVFVMRSHGAPASSAPSTGSPSVRFEPSPSEPATDATAADPLNPSAGTTIPTLQSLLEVASQVIETNAAEHAAAAETADSSAPPSTDTPERAAAFSIGVTAPSNEGTPVQKANPDRAAAEPPAASIDAASFSSDPAAAPSVASAAPANANPPQSFSSAAESFALDTSRDLVILDPNADFQRWAAMDHAPAPGDLGQSVDTTTTTVSAPVDPAAPLPKMLPVVWQTMQLLREQGKIKIHTSPPIPQPPVHGPAGAGSGAGLPSFIPNSGPLIPGGSLGSTKTLAILRELSAARRPFFSIQSLVSTVCSMRAERKWAKRAANAEKKKLLAAGITIAQPSGIPNDQMAAQQQFGVGRQKRSAAGGMSKQGSTTNVHAAAATGVSSGAAQPLSAAQFALLTTPQSLAGRNVRAIQVVDEEADEALAAASRAAALEAEQSGRDQAASEESAVKMPPGATHWGSASQKFLPPAAFPPSLHVPAFPAPPPQPSHKKGASSSSSMQAAGLGDAGFNESETRAWARSRLLAHLSGLLLFQGSPSRAAADGSRGAGTQAQVDVQIRMGDLESLLDALAQGPRDAAMLAEKLARKEREALEKEAAAAPMGEPRGDAALAALAALPPLSHPIAPLLALLSWLDKQEATFPTVQALVRSVSSGAWSHTFKQLERGRKQRVQTQSQMMAAQIAQQLEAIDQPI